MWPRSCTARWHRPARAECIAYAGLTRPTCPAAGEQGGCHARRHGVAHEHERQGGAGGGGLARTPGEQGKRQAQARNGAEGCSSASRFAPAAAAIHCHATAAPAAAATAAAVSAGKVLWLHRLHILANARPAGPLVCSQPPHQQLRPLRHRISSSSSHHSSRSSRRRSRSSSAAAAPPHPPPAPSS